MNSITTIRRISAPLALRLLLSASIVDIMLAACSPVSIRPPQDLVRTPRPAPAQIGAPATSGSVAHDDPELVDESYGGYNIVRYRGHLYSLPQTLGAFDPGAAQKGSYLEGDSIAQLQHAIEEVVIPQREHDADASPETPGLIWEDYHLFNLVRYGGHTYAVRRDGMPFDPLMTTGGKYLTADSIALLRDAVATRGTAELEMEADRNPASPTLVDSNVNGYNLIRFNLKTFAIRKDDGEFDAQRFDGGGYTAAHVAASATEVRAQVGDMLSGESATQASAVSGQPAAPLAETTLPSRIIRRARGD